MGISVGIDLGTTYTCVSKHDRASKTTTIIKNKFGNAVTPSVIGFRPDGTYVIGEEAKSMEEIGDVNTASFYKLHMGDNSKYRFYNKEYTARDLSSLFLKRLIEDMNKNEPEKIDKAVITVPAYFIDAAKNDTIKAGEAAGLQVINIINEPTAACIAYGVKEKHTSGKILIYDLGGGTFDVTIANVHDGKIDVIATGGHHHLGGRDWDTAVCEWLKEQYMLETGIDLSGDNETVSTIMINVEKAKKQLTATNKTEISVDNGEKKCKFTLTRELFEDLTDYQLSLTTDIIDELFEEKGLTWKDIAGAVLVGGSTKMPMVRNYITGNGINILDGVHPDEAVSIGAAIQASVGTRVFALGGPERTMALGDVPTVSDVISHTLGMVSISSDGTRFVNDMMIKRNTPVSEAHTTKRRELTVRKGNDNHLEIYLLQGESEIPSECVVAKKYIFDKIEFVQGCKTLIDITYHHTVNGTIDVSAIQTETNKELVIREEPIPEDMSWLDKSPKEVFPAPKSPGIIVLALDVSGSMMNEPMRKAKEAMKNFVSEFTGKNIVISVFAFSNSVYKMCDPTKDTVVLFDAIDRIDCCNVTDQHGNRVSVGGGNSATPLEDMFKIIDNSRPETEGKKDGLLSKVFNNKAEFGGYGFAYSIVLTDGRWNDSACRLAKEQKKLYVDSGYDVIGLGFGSADITFLRDISTKADMASVGTIDTLNSNLSSIARIID